MSNFLTLMIGQSDFLLPKLNLTGRSEKNRHIGRKIGKKMIKTLSISRLLPELGFIFGEFCIKYLEIYTIVYKFARIIFMI